MFDGLAAYAIENHNNDTFEVFIHFPGFWEAITKLIDFDLDKVLEYVEDNALYERLEGGLDALYGCDVMELFEEAVYKSPEYVLDDFCKGTRCEVYELPTLRHIQDLAELLADDSVDLIIHY